MGSVDQLYVVHEPKAETEFEVQAWLWNELRSLGVNVRGEVKAAFRAHSDRRAQCRFDLAIFDDGRLTGIVEVKNAAPLRSVGWENTRQGWRYSQYGVPVRVVYGMDEAKRLISAVRNGSGIFE